jgi:hypothetical protein
VQRPEDIALHHRLLGPAGLGARRLRGPGADRIELWIEGFGALEHAVHHLDRRDRLRSDQACEVDRRSVAEVRIWHVCRLG